MLDLPNRLLIALFAMVLIAPSALAAPPPANAKWTVMLYISGDNNLEDYVVKDIEEELAPTGSSNDVKVVVLADRGPGYDTSRGNWETTKLFHVTQGMFATPEAAVADWGERNMGDPQTLIDFVSWTRANHPAHRYALYFWGHGWNTHPGYTMSDDTGGDALDAPELRNALQSLGFIDVIGFDGCNMAAIEVQKLWAGAATAVVASQEYVNWDGLEYETILPQLHSNPAMNADQLAAISALSSQGNNERTGSAVAVDARFTAMYSALDQWAIALKATLPTQRKHLQRAFGATRTFWQVPYEKDFKDLVMEVNARVTDTNLRNKGTALINAINGAIIAEWSTNAYADAHGITIYQIDTAAQKDEYWSYYQGLGLVPSSWIAFLDAYAR